MKESQPALFGEMNILKHGEKVKKPMPKMSTQYISSVWSFPGRSATQFYRWYGTLPRELVERLFTLYTNPNSRVLDPFSGLGTSLDVALDHKLKAGGIDINPLACMVTETRISGVPSHNSVRLAVAEIVSDLKDYTPNQQAIQDGIWHDVVMETHYTYARKWFRKDTLNAVLNLLFRIASVKDVRVQRFLFIAAAQVVREVASIDPRCTHHLVTKQKPYRDPLPLWRKLVDDVLPSVRTNAASATDVSITQGSILTSKIEENSIDFALLHPPYLGVIHYHLIHRLATDILDMVNRAAHPTSLLKYNFNYALLKNDDMSTDRTDRYLEFVEELAQVMCKAIRPDGRCAIIIGDQRHNGHLRHPFSDFIKCFEQLGFKLEENFIWLLQNNGGMHVLRRGHFIDHNYILVFHKTPKN